MKLVSRLRSHGWISWTLITVGTIVTVVALLASWVNRQALDTDQWVKTSSALLRDPAIQEATASFLAQQIVTSQIAKDRVEEALPPDLKRLSGPLTGVLGQATERVALQVLRSGGFEDIWRESNRLVHQQLLAVIEGRNFEVEGNTVVLDLRPMLGRLATRVGLGEDAIDNLPQDAARVRVLGGDEIGAVQQVADLLQGLQWVSVALTFVFLLGGIALAPDRRKATIRVGGGLIIVGLLVVTVRRVAGNEIVDALTDGGTREPAANAVWTIATSLLSRGAWAILIFGVALVVGSYLIGPGDKAAKLRSLVAPHMKNNALIPIVVAVSVALILVALGLLPWATRPVAVLIYLAGATLFAIGYQRRTLAEQKPKST